MQLYRTATGPQDIAWIERPARTALNAETPTTISTVRPLARRLSMTRENFDIFDASSPTNAILYFTAITRLLYRNETPETGSLTVVIRSLGWS